MEIDIERHKPILRENADWIRRGRQDGRKGSQKRKRVSLVR